MKMMTLSIEPSKCTGCGDCETACSSKRFGVNDPALSSIRIIRGDESDHFYLPSTCQQCENPPCLAVCPKHAIYRNEGSNRVIIDYELCVGCKMCVSACPFGAMGYEENRGFAFKCDLCGGKPECVDACDPGALDYIDAFNIQQPQVLQSAMKLAGMAQRMGAMG